MKGKVTLALLVLVLAVNLANAAIFGYDPQNGEYPGAGWTSGGQTNPIYGFGENGTVAALNTAGSDKGYWYYLNSGISDAGYTLDFRLAVDNDASPSATPFAIYTAASGEMDIIRIDSATGIKVDQEGGGTRGTNPVVIGNAFHVYRYTRLGQNFAVYMDDIATPMVSGTLNNNNAIGSLNRILFGKGDSICSGTSGLDYIVWDTSGANFEPPIPEPATLALLAIGGLAIRRKK